jgi:hypothetical protein
VGFPTATIVWVAFIIVWQRFGDYVVQPLVYGKALRVNPIVTIVSVLAGASLLGILAALLAIPTAARSRSYCATGGQIGSAICRLRRQRRTRETTSPRRAAAQPQPITRSYIGPSRRAYVPIENGPTTWNGTDFRPDPIQIKLRSNRVTRR